METAHADYAIDIVDEHGTPIRQKPRKEVDKTTDLYHGVYVLVVTPAKELVLSVIPARDDLPNLYANKLGITVATIRRHGETKDAAAARVLATEIHCDQSGLHHIGDTLAALPDGRKTYLSLYYIVSGIPATYSQQDIKTIVAMDADALDSKLASEPEATTPTLQFVWQTYRQQLPV